MLVQQVRCYLVKFEDNTFAYVFTEAPASRQYRVIVYDRNGNPAIASHEVQMIADAAYKGVCQYLKVNEL